MSSTLPSSARITALDVLDVRFPTSEHLDGSDAMNPEPDDCAAYVLLRTDAGDGLEGHALAFTTGRGNDVQAAAISFPLAHPDIINVTLGMRNRQPVVRNVELHRQLVPDNLREELRAQGLIRSDVPAASGPGRSARCL